MAGNYTSFGGAVEQAIKKNQLSPAEQKAAARLAQLSPAERAIQRELDLKRAAAKSTKPNTSLKTTTNTSIKPVRTLPPASGGMRTVTGKAVTVADDAAKIAGSGSKVGGALKVVGKGLGKVATPLAALEQAYQTGRLVFNEDAREEAAQGYEDMADARGNTATDVIGAPLGLYGDAAMRTVKGGLGGVTTIYGAGKALADTAMATANANKSAREADEKAADPKMQSILQAVKDRQATYMGLSKEERAMVDGMGAKEAKQYLQDKQSPPSMKKGSPSFVGPPKSAMFPESMKEGSPSFIGPRVPKAIPVAEPIEVDQDRAMALFQNTHGGPFDPKSSMDKAKMAAIQNLMAQKGSERLTPNQFSLKIYRQS